MKVIYKYPLNLTEENVVGAQFQHDQIVAWRSSMTVSQNQKYSSKFLAQVGRKKTFQENT